MSAPKILVAGVGNIFMGDDGFGVEVVRRLSKRRIPPGVAVKDFGIRGFDLATALLEPNDLVVLVDDVRRGGPAGTLYLLEIGDLPEDPAPLAAHNLVPAQVFRVVRSMGGSLKNVFLVACEPLDFGDPDVGRMSLSPAVEAALDGAVEMVESLVYRALAEAGTHA
jgi:hydrogenase maturation protease